MQKFLTAVAWGGALSLATIAGNARADALHGICAGSVPNCSDNGNNSPNALNAPNPFGFTVSPGPQTGDLRIEVLVPNNEASIPSTPSFKISGGATSPATASLFSPTAWTSGFLDVYLGINASASNPIGAFLGPCSVSKPCTKDLDPGATGFFVYQADLGTNTLPSPSHPNDNLTIDTQLPLASFIDGFLEVTTTSGKGKDKTTTTNWITTASSGAIFETSDCAPGTPNCNLTPPPPPPVVPEPSALALVGGALLMFGPAWRRRSV